MQKLIPSVAPSDIVFTNDSGAVNSISNPAQRVTRQKITFISKNICRRSKKILLLMRKGTPVDVPLLEGTK